MSIAKDDERDTATERHEAVGVYKNSPRSSMNVLRQVADGERGRVILEEDLPGFIILSIVFPVSKRWRKGSIRWTREKHVRSGVFGVGPAELAVRRLIRVKALAIFARRGVVCQGASHTAGGLNVVARKHQEEAFCMLVADVGLEQSALSSYWDPSMAFIRLGL